MVETLSRKTLSFFLEQGSRAKAGRVVPAFLLDTGESRNHCQSSGDSLVQWTWPSYETSVVSEIYFGNTVLDSEMLLCR